MKDDFYFSAENVKKRDKRHVRCLQAGAVVGFVGGTFYTGEWVIGGQLGGVFGCVVAGIANNARDAIFRRIALRDMLNSDEVMPEKLPEY